MALGNWQRIPGMLALLALALHGAVAFGHAHDAGLDSHECTICHVQSLSCDAGESPADGVPAAAEARAGAESTAPVVSEPEGS